jgi:hypothetical protein
LTWLYTHWINLWLSFSLLSFSLSTCSIPRMATLLRWWGSDDWIGLYRP